MAFELLKLILKAFSEAFLLETASYNPRKKEYLYKKGVESLMIIPDITGLQSNMLNILFNLGCYYVARYCLHSVYMKNPAEAEFL